MSQQSPNIKPASPEPEFPYRWPIIIIVLILIALMAFFYLVINRAGPAGTPTPTPTAPAAVAPAATTPTVVGALAIPKRPSPPPGMLYNQSDFLPSDLGTLFPNFGPFGAENKDMEWVGWASEIRSFLNNAEKLQVRLLNGDLIAKPTIAGIMLTAGAGATSSPSYGNGGITWDYWADFTPRSVYDNMGVKTGYILDPGCGKTAVMPRYDDTRWQQALFAAVAQFGREYKNDPRLTAIEINSGFDGEPRFSKSVAGCDFDGAAEKIINHRDFDLFMYRMMDAYAKAFDVDGDGKPDKPIYVHLFWDNKARAEYAISKGIGIKFNSLTDDANWFYNYDKQGNQEDSGFGMMALAYDLGPKTFLAFESGQPWKPYPDSFVWMSYLAALSAHPDFIDNYRSWTEGLLQKGGSAYEPDTPLNFIQRHLGVTLETTPDVWVALRDTEINQCDDKRCYTGYRGDWNFWLYRRDGLPENGTVLVGLENSETWNGIPEAARNQIYARRARRTDEANGQHLMSFDIDDGYPYVNLRPRSQPGGTASYEVSILYLDQGTDTMSLEYLDSSGTLHSAPLIKTNTQRFRRHTWQIDDAFFNNGLPGKTDFRINSNNDGDETIHLVMVRGTGNIDDRVSPTATKERTNTPVPPANTATATPRPRPPSPSSTPTPRPRPPSPSSTPTPNFGAEGTPQAEVLALQTQVADLSGRVGTVEKRQALLERLIDRLQTLIDQAISALTP